MHSRSSLTMKLTKWSTTNEMAKNILLEWLPSWAVLNSIESDRWNATIIMTSMNANYVTTVYILKPPQDSSLYMNWRSDR